ncbi:ubiquitin carboxyl-terminal hydrolase-domain-containing protein [Mariannaea sp. PMI_226]|nr:ubiquitin carboxyl-terminal hydrolase-domain-containing protein [Mariannaea sp. PMI_226]
MKEFPRKFLSLRDKNGSSRRAKSTSPGPSPTMPKTSKPRPLSTGAFMAMFKPDNSRKSLDIEQKENDTGNTGKDILRRLDELNITGVTTDHISDILATKFANGDPRKAVEFIDIEQKAAAGIILPYDPTIEMVGAVNRSNVTCYLDALLFAMFSKLDAFECMLKNDFPEDDSRVKLVTLLRMWVNMLRTGHLIHTDLTKLIQDALADCGWSDARLLEQQDTSEAFAFLTETLQLPLLSLQVDLFHQGKKDKDDHKVVYERLLNLAVPPDPEEKGIKLEDCLEEYFNAQVDVQRDSEEAKKSSLQDITRSRSETLKLVHRDTLRLLTKELGEASTPTVTASPIAISPLQRIPTIEKEPASPSLKISPERNTDEDAETPTAEQTDRGKLSSTEPATAQQKPTLRTRSTSVIQRVLIDEQGNPSNPDSPTMLQKAMSKGSTVVKAVTIPAWQFFRLIPWHALTSNEPQNNVDVALNFDRRPVVGICLKRYAMTESGQPKRHNTFIDIPDCLRLPHFMMADDLKLEEENNMLNSEYKLVLQSVICHRGDSLQSGHYIAFARVAPKLLTDNRRHDFDPPPDYEEAQWVRFDDLQIENRVTYVDDIKQSLKDEMPYLLFYQVVPMVEVTPPSVEDTETEPPSYNDSKISFELPPTPIRLDDSRLGSLSQTDSYFDPTPTAETAALTTSKPPSIRLSSESDRPGRRSSENYRSLLSDSRRPSFNLADSTYVTPAVTPSSYSPTATPNEEATGSRLSRAASRFTKGNRSRPSSQTGENRISFSMTRYVGLMRPSKELLADMRDANILGTASLNSTGPLIPESFREDDENQTQQEPEQSHAHHSHTHKHSHKRIRSKEKIKHKSGSQPERECSVM